MQVQIYLPTNAFIYVALAFFAVIIIIRIVRWIIHIVA
jgi:hypothetical protein